MSAITASNMFVGPDNSRAFTSPQTPLLKERDFSIAGRWRLWKILMLANARAQIMHKINTCPPVANGHVRLKRRGIGEVNARELKKHFVEQQ